MAAPLAIIEDNFIPLPENFNLNVKAIVTKTSRVVATAMDL
jgi:hypothetical protein